MTLRHKLIAENNVKGIERAQGRLLLLFSQPCPLSEFYAFLKASHDFTGMRIIDNDMGAIREQWHNTGMLAACFDTQTELDAARKFLAKYL